MYITLIIILNHKNYLSWKIVFLFFKREIKVQKWLAWGCPTNRCQTGIQILSVAPELELPILYCTASGPLHPSGPLYKGWTRQCGHLVTSAKSVCPVTQIFCHSVHTYKWLKAPWALIWVLQINFSKNSQIWNLQRMRMDCTCNIILFINLGGSSARCWEITKTRILFG